MFNFWYWLISLEMWVRYLCMCFFWLGAIFILICWLKGKKGYEEEQKEIEEFAYREGLKEKKVKEGVDTKGVKDRLTNKKDKRR